MKNKNKILILNPGGGRPIAVSGARLLLKLASETTDNRLSITEYELPPQFPGPPPHQHKIFEHAWYVLEGDLTVRLNEKILTLTKGSFIFIPRQTVHAFANKSNIMVKVLVIDTPGGFEHYYEELHGAFGDRAIDQNEIRKIQLTYDTYPPDHSF